MNCAAWSQCVCFREQTRRRKNVHRHRQREAVSLQCSWTGGNIGVILTAATVAEHISSFKVLKKGSRVVVLLYKDRSCIQSNKTAQTVVSEGSRRARVRVLYH
jgi:hypothetical protein